MQLLFKSLYLSGAILLTQSVAAAESVQIWLTTPDQTHLLSRQADVRLAKSAAVAEDIRIDSNIAYQTMQGFGAAMTDASAIILRQKMPKQVSDQVMQELFGRGEQGIGFDFIRAPVGASDFSASHFSLDDVAPGQEDPQLAHLSLSPQKEMVLPALLQARAINPELKVMISPWSAPAWMKTNRQLYKGMLRPDLYPVYARYLAGVVQRYQAEGLPVYALSIQNEPHFEPDNYPGMRFNTADRARFIGQYLGPQFKADHITTRILDWDHNWDQPESPAGVLADESANPYIAGVAWHCYAGQPSAQSQVHRQFPNKETWLTECSGGGWNPEWEKALPWITRQLIIGSTRNWAKGVLMWNLILDQHAGPHLGGCTDCRGMMSYDSETGALHRNIEYYAFAHASKFVRSGALRIDSSGGKSDVEHVAFLNPDHSVVLVLCNTADQERDFGVTWNRMRFTYRIPAHSVITAVWH